MKLATLRDGTRDGRLIVVDRTLRFAAEVPDICKTLQEALENWTDAELKLAEIDRQLNSDQPPAGSFELKTGNLAAPLPRAYQWLDASAYVNHVELVRKARGATLPDNFWRDPLMYQGASDRFLSARDPIELESAEWGIDFEAEIGIITDDVPMGLNEEAASKHIKLLVLLNDISLRNLIPAELTKGFGFLQGKPTTSFSPAAITPDELGAGWRGSRVWLPLCTYLNDQLFGNPEAGPDMTFNFARLIAHAAKTRFLGAGTILGSGTISNKNRSRGSSCIAERRMLEIIDHQEAKTPFLKFGDRIRIEMRNPTGENLFGSIDQMLCRYVPS